MRCLIPAFGGVAHGGSRADRRVRLHLAARVPRAVVLFCPLAHRPERLLSEKEAGNVPSGWGMGGFDTHA
ncbi:hypothetical protein NXX35_28275 (plasmid) [Bacteroides xylanisolvens]|nr:hypothetical protein NXX35_28275 [Bacteroides xylanisolvens]